MSEKFRRRISGDIKWLEQDIVKALNQSLDGDTNPTEQLITGSYDKFDRIIWTIFSYRHDNGGSERVDELFDDTVIAIMEMQEALFRIKVNTQEEKRKWMPILLRYLHKFRKAPWFRYRGDRFLEHLDAMSAFRHKNWPVNEAAWKNGDIIGNPDFDEIFGEFIELGEEDLPESQHEGRRLVQSSVTLVLQASHALLVSLDSINIPLANLVNEKTRPTCVDTPISNPLFLSGTEKRPGALALKAYLGGPHTESQSLFPLDSSYNYSGGKRDFSKFSDPSPESNEYSYSKRQAVDQGENLGSKYKVYQSQGSYYDYTLEDVDRDIEDLRLITGITESGEFSGKLQSKKATPVWTMPADVLQKYKPTLLQEMRKWEWAWELAQSRRPDEISDALDELETRMAEMREYIAWTRAQGRPNYTNLKTLKCTAFVLRYLRSLHLRIIMTTRPGNDLLQARADRLTDWIIHEEVWNDSHQFALARMKPIHKNRARFERDVEGRKNNIAQWKAQIQALNDAISEKRVAVEAEDIEIDAATKNYPPVDQKEDIDHALDSAALNKQLNKALESPARVLDTFNQYAPSIRAHGTSMPSKKGTKREERREFKVFAAGGPPGYKDLPKEGVYDKLQYMIILTYWRVLQAQLHGL